MNKIKSLPKEIGNWKMLEEVNFSHNKIKILPKEIGQFEQVFLFF